MPITYHSGDIFWQYNQDDNTNRIYYYPPHGDGSYYTPYAWIDGCVRGGYTYSSWWALTNPRVELGAPLDITLEGTYDIDAKTGNLHISIYAEEAITLQSLKLRVALTEDSIYYSAPNGTMYHNYTLRDMIPNAAGEAISISQGQTLEFDKAFALGNTPVPHFCRLVVWVQTDSENLEILQGAAIDIEELDDGTGIDDKVELPRKFSLAQNYPNPFNAGTLIGYDLKVDSHVELCIYDILGKKIATLVNNEQFAGEKQITWNGFDDEGRSVASGVYFYKLSADGISETRQMMLVK